MKYNKNFERDYEFYLKNVNNFDFCGEDIRKKIQFIDDDLSKKYNFKYNKNGNDAKKCFYIFDSNGKYLDCYEPNLLLKLFICKGAINMQIKMWAEALSEMDDSILSIKESIDELHAPDWVLKSVMNQALKLLKHKQPDYSWRELSIVNLIELEND